MKVKRIIFVIILIMLFAVCYYKMNQHYDDLARYPHVLSEEERILVLENLDTEGINYLVTQKITPQQFLPYITTDGFELGNTLWYDRAMQTKKEDKSYIINFINKYKANMKYTDLASMIKSYSYNILTRFFDEGDANIPSARLVGNPSDMYTLIGGQETLYTFEPENLINLTSIPHTNAASSAKDILLQKDVLKPLQELCEGAKDMNQKACGDMQVVTGYVSYEHQLNLYEETHKKATAAKKDDLSTTFWDFPGQSEFQLGFSVRLEPNAVTKTATSKTTKEPSEEEREQAVWLSENAYKYGFIVRYPKDSEQVTGKPYNPYILRYVGRDYAKTMHDQDILFEHMKFDNKD